MATSLNGTSCCLHSKVGNDAITLLQANSQVHMDRPKQELWHNDKLLLALQPTGHSAAWTDLTASVLYQRALGFQCGGSKNKMCPLPFDYF